MRILDRRQLRATPCVVPFYFDGKWRSCGKRAREAHVNRNRWRWEAAWIDHRTSCIDARPTERLVESSASKWWH